MLRIRGFVVSPLYSNCYVVDLGDGAEAVVIDPGDSQLQPVLAYIEAHRLHVTAIWCTHAHLDHIAGVDVLRDRYGVPAYVHKDDLPVWESFPEAVRNWFGEPAAPIKPPDGLWNDGDVVALGHVAFTVRHTPGHSPGSVCLVGESVAFTGDTLFAGSIGRTDLPLSDPDQMWVSLRKIAQWPQHLILYPGHMQATTLAQELASNPFLRGGG